MRRSALADNRIPWNSKNMLGARPLMIIGCGGHGRVVADIVRARNDTLAGFLDDNFATTPSDVAVTGPVHSEIRRLIATHRFVVGIGSSNVRRKLSEAVLAAGGELATLFHPSAIIAPDILVGAGTVVMAGVIVNVGTHIGRFAVLNTGCIVDHDNVVEDNVHVSPGCSLAGNVTCKMDSFIGTGASIIPRVTIGEGAYVAAGATVTRDVPPHVLVAGCPAVVKKRL